jgi:hypothetical protein
MIGISARPTGGLREMLHQLREQMQGAGARFLCTSLRLHLAHPLRPEPLATHRRGRPARRRDKGQFPHDHDGPQQPLGRRPDPEMVGREGIGRLTAGR